MNETHHFFSAHLWDSLPNSWPESDWEEAGENKMLDSWQIGEVRDSEMTADRLRDWEEKVAENVKHADGYLHEVERIHHIYDVTFLQSEISKMSLHSFYT